MNQISFKEENGKFFDRWAKSYDNFIFSWWMKYVQRKLLLTLQLNQNTSVLDVGCGTGYMLLLLSNRIKKGKIVGMDISSEMLKIAKEKIKNRNENIALLQGEIEKIPFPHNKFDYVISMEAFHHFPNPRKALQEMKRVVKRRGKIVIADISIPPHPLFNLLFKFEPGFVRMYSKKEIMKLARKAGLKVTKQKRVGLFAVIHVFHPL